jgi:hypothetical protein
MLVTIGVAFWVTGTLGLIAPLVCILVSWTACAYATLVFGASMLLLTTVPRHILRVTPPLVSARPRPGAATKRCLVTLMHPHGVLNQNMLVIAASLPPGTACTAFPLRCVLNALFFQFGWRFVCSSRSSVEASMRAKRDVYVYPGGFREAARHSYARDVVDVGSRGMIQLALMHGCGVRVAFAFGERKTAYNLQGLWTARMWLAKRGIPAVVPLVFLWGAAPRIALSSVIQFPHIAAPSAEEIEHWHSEYVAELRLLHAEFREPDDELVVLDVRAKAA